MRRVGDLCRLVVTDLRVERRDKHEAVVHQLLDPRIIRLDAAHAVLLEAHAGVADQAGRLQEVGADDGLEHVQLVVSLRTADRDSHVVTHHLGSHHRHRLALRRVHLARHDRATRFVGRDDDLADATARTGGHHANVVGDLVERHGQLLQCAVSLHHGVVCGQRLELVLSRHKGQPRELGDVTRHDHVVTLRRVDTRAHGRATERQLAEVRQGVAECAEAMIELCSIARELLSERQRRSVHQVRTADLDHVLELLRLLLQRVAQALYAGDRRLHHHLVGRDVHARGIGVVRRLRLVHVVVRLQRLLALADLLARQLMGAVSDHLVHVHVRLRARARLPDHKRELVIEFPLQDLVAHPCDQVTLLYRQHAQLVVGVSSGLFQVRKAVDHLQRHGGRRPDLEIVTRALRLRSPDLVGGDFHLAHRVFFDSEICHCSIFFW